MRRQFSVVTASAIALTTVGWFVLNVHVPAVAAAIDPSTAVRGSLGVSLENFAIHSTFGDFTLDMNGALAMQSVAFATIVVGGRTQKRKNAQRTAPATGAPVRATMGEAWARLSRPLGG